MNVIIANKYNEALSNLNIDVIKKLDGEFDAETIKDTFANFYFNRMIIDITAIKDYLNLASIQKISANLDASKIILFLDDDPRINNSYLSKIISLGIYNFTRELSGVSYLMENPNTYRDVAQYHDLALEDEKNIEKAGQNTTPTQNQGFTPFNEYNNYQNNNFAYNSTHILGFKDLTSDAGSTTLIYMLKKQLSHNHKVLALELNKNDFSYFKDNELMSTSNNLFSSVKSRFSNFDVILIDLNNANPDIESQCTDVIYLLEPSTIKLNTIMRRDKDAINKLKDKKIVLNKSLLSVSDVKEFEYEANAHMFYNIPPLDERKDTQMVLESFLNKLGVGSSSSDSASKMGNIFGNIFKKN